MFWVDPEDLKESPLSDLSLDAIFLHIQSRVDNTVSHSDEDILYMKGEILRILGEASHGILETQIRVDCRYWAVVSNTQRWRRYPNRLRPEGENGNRRGFTSPFKKENTSEVT